MIDELLGLAFRALVEFLLRLVLFPIALLVSTPFIVIRAAVLALRHRGKFGNLIADAYSSIDVYWWN